MPGIGTFIAVSVIGLTAGSIGAVVVGGLIGAGLAMGASMILSGVLSPKTKQRLSVNQPVPLQMIVSPPRQFAYGKTATGGHIVYWETTGTNNEFLWLVVALHDTPIESIESFIVENAVISFTANAATNVFVSGGSARMWRYDKLGAESQTVETNLAANSAVWTSNHRLRGVAYYLLKLQHEAAVFPLGLPQPIVVLKGRKIWDPRLDPGYGGSGAHNLGTESTYAWSANPALCLLDYLLGVNINGKRIGGCGIPIGNIDHTSFQAAANVCDENVSLLAGGTEDRYTCHGFIDALEEKEGVVESLLLAMHGTLVLRGGKIYLVAGAAQTSVMALTDDDLAGELVINPSNPRQDKANKITCVFADPSQNYAAVPGPPLTVAQYVTDDGGITLEREIQHRFTTSTTTVNRLNKLILASFREQLSVQARFKPKALETSAGDTFTWTSTAAGYTSPTKMICFGRQLMPDGSVEIVARQETDAKYSWATSEEQTPPSFGAGPYGTLPPAPGAVSGLAVTQSGNTITLTWTEVTVSPHLTGYDILYGAQGGVIGGATLLSQDSRLTRYTTNSVVPGAWKFYVRARDAFGQTGTADTEDFTVLSSSSAASTLDHLIGVDMGFNADLRLSLDAGYSGSYPGSGTTWTDTAGTNDNLTIPSQVNFYGTAGGLSANEYFQSDATALGVIAAASTPSWANSFHQNNAEFTIAALVRALDGVGRMFTLLSTYNAAAGHDTGFHFQVDEENFELRFEVFNNGVTVLSVIHPLEFGHLDGSWAWFGVTVNEAAGTGHFSINGVNQSFTSTYSSPSAAASESILAIGRFNVAITNMPNNDRITALFAMENAMTGSEWIDFYELFRMNRPGFNLP